MGYRQYHPRAGFYSKAQTEQAFILISELFAALSSEAFSLSSPYLLAPEALGLLTLLLSHTRGGGTNPSFPCRIMGMSAGLRLASPVCLFVEDVLVPVRMECRQKKILCVPWPCFHGSEALLH